MHTAKSILIDVPSKVPQGLDTVVPNKNMNPLHAACERFDVKEIRRLLESGHNPNALDEHGRSPLHILLNDVFYGHINEVKMLECMKTLIDHRCDINSKDLDGESPLSLAVDYKLESCATYLVKKGADTTVRSKRFKGQHSLASTIAQSMPEVMTSVLDSGVMLEYANGGIPLVKLDWSRVLQYSDHPEDLSRKHTIVKHKYKQRESSFLYSLLDVPVNTRNKLLKHPLVEAFLYQKSKRLSRRIRFCHLILSTYPIFYMAFIYFMYFNQCKLEDSNDDVGNSSTTPRPRELITRQECDITLTMSIASYALMAIVILYGLFEVFMLLRIDTTHMRNWRSWVARVAMVVMACTLWPGLWTGKRYDISWQYSIAAIGAFLAWVMFLIQMELIPQVKIYLEMLVAVIVSVLKIILLFLPLLIGFYMGFNLMFTKSGVSSLMNFVLMTVDVGSNEYEDLIDDAKDSATWFRIIADVFSLTFIVVIAIVFMNFLLGVSISDIQELKHYAKVMSLSNLVQNQFIVDLIFSTRFNVVPTSDVERKNWFLTYKPSDGVFPKDIQRNITLLLKSKYATPHTPKCIHCSSADATDATLQLPINYTMDEGTTVDKLEYRLDKLESKINTIIDKIHEQD